MSVLANIQSIMRAPGFESLTIGPRVMQLGRDVPVGEIVPRASMAVTLTFGGKQTEAAFFVSSTGEVSDEVLTEAVQALLG